MDLSCFGPSGDEVGLRDGGQGCGCGERLSPDAVDGAEMGNGSELEEGVFVQRIPVVLIIIGIGIGWKIKREKKTELALNGNAYGNGILIRSGETSGRAHLRHFEFCAKPTSCRPIARSL